MERVYEEAFYEVDEVLKLMPIDLRSKIPMQFRQAISENKAKNYKVDIHEPLREQELKKETVIILGLIYRDFLASPEERERLQRSDSEELQKLEQEMQEQYNMETVFKKKKEKNNIQQSENNNQLIIYKEKGIFHKILDFIKRIFKRDKF